MATKKRKAASKRKPLKRRKASKVKAAAAKRSTKRKAPKAKREKKASRKKAIKARMGGGGGVPSPNKDASQHEPATAAGELVSQELISKPA